MHTPGYAPPRTPRHADQRGYLTLSLTLLLLLLFALLVVLQPPSNAQHVVAQTSDAPDTNSIHQHPSADTPDIPVQYFHWRAGMGLDAAPPQP